MTDINRLIASLKRRSAHAKEFGDSITFVKLADIDALVEALEKAQQLATQQGNIACALFDEVTAQRQRIAGLEESHAQVIQSRDHYKRMSEEGLKQLAEPRTVTVKLPEDLHPDTQELVIDFCTALAEKLYKAQLKYGYDADWKKDGWPSQCQAHFHQHIIKGDPRDVAAYCAFMWWHGWSTKPTELESRTVVVKLPDYRNTYKDPFADEVEHQVRLALELFSSAAGIKWEAE